MGQSVCELWRRVGSGIWEERGKASHHTYSKVMCWVALHRLLQLHEGGHLQVPAARFDRERQAIRKAIEERGLDRERQFYRGTFDGNDIDASLLALPIYGYIAADDPRMRKTYEIIWEQLGSHGLLRRYRQIDGQPLQEEGAFGAACFWSAECLALQGQAEEARAQFDLFLRYANDVGLYGEEIEVKTGATLGNFPQAYTHIGLINAAVALNRLEGGKDKTRKEDDAP